MKNLKTFIAGALTGIILASLPVLADSVRQMIEVELNTVNITVDGKKVDGDNILYNDRTYVPLRAIAEMLGKNVSWDQETNTASISDFAGVTYSGSEVGKVNGKSILSEQLDTYKSLAKVNNPQMSDEEIEKTAKEMIVYDIALADYAKKYGVEINSEFEERYNSYMQYISSQYPQFLQLLQAVGYTEKSYKQAQQSDYLADMVLSEAPADYSVTDTEASDFYNTNKENFKYDGLRAKHILFSVLDKDGNELDENAKQEVYKKATDVYNRIKKGEDFDTLMKEFTEDPGIAQNPDGYTFTKGELVSAFEEKAYSMNVGDVSEPVLSEYGYHIIKLMEKIDYKSFESQKESIKVNLALEKLKKDVNDFAASYTVSWN